MEWLNFRHLFAFWSVCRYGGFQKAADKIHVSQSAVSDQVSQLEEYLDLKLIERSTRSFRITPEGEKLLQYADEIFTKSQEINQIFKDNQEDLKGSRLRVGMVGGISRNFIFSLIRQHLMETDQSRLDIVDGSFTELSQMLKNYELDLVFSLEAPNKRELLNLTYSKVESSPLCIAGRPELMKNLKSKRKRSGPMEIYLFNHQYELDLFEDLIQPKFSLEATVPVVTDDISLLRFLANSGRGLALIPEIGIQEDLSGGHLSRIRLTEVNPVDFYGIYLKNGYHKSLIQSFLA